MFGLFKTIEPKPPCGHDLVIVDVEHCEKISSISWTTYKWELRTLKCTKCNKTFIDSNKDYGFKYNARKLNYLK